MTGYLRCIYYSNIDSILALCNEARLRYIKFDTNRNFSSLSDKSSKEKTSNVQEKTFSYNLK